MTTRYAVIGTGHRAQMYLDAIAGPHADVAQLVALIDSNPARREYYRGRFEQFADAESAGPEQLEELIERLAVDRVIVTSPDRLHAEHVVRALDAGADRKSTRLNSSHVASSYAVFCLKKKHTELLC